MKTSLNFFGGGSSSIINNFYSEVTEATGFVNPDDSEMSFDNGTRYFTIDVAEGSDSFVFWAFGNRYEKTSAESVQIDDVDGLWYIYYDADGVLGATQDIWDLSTQVPVATILWSGGAGTVDDNKTNPKPSKFINAYIMSISLPGSLEDAQIVLFHAVAGSETVELQKRLPYSIIKCGTAPTAQADFDIQVNGVSKGTGTIPSGQTTGSFTFNSTVTLNAGDLVKVIAPSSADATLEDLAITIEGIRV